MRLAFVGGLSLHSEGCHFIVDSNAEVHDGRDSRTLGAYRSDSIDVFILCVGEERSSRQEQELRYLVEALRLDYADNEQLQVHRVNTRFPLSSGEIAAAVVGAAGKQPAQRTTTKSTRTKNIG